MQILRPGISVHARRRTWRVVEARPYDDCQLVTLTGLGPANAGHEALLLVPFDAIEPVRRSTRVRFTGPAPWRRSFRQLIGRGFSDAHLRTAGGARMDILPHQLEPAIAVVRGDANRLLLADDVGLGKTIQAGLIIAELRARGAADRVLVVTPAGLRDQWADELSRRFDVPSEIVDVRAVVLRTSALPLGVNPWTTWPIAVASIDYIKRAEVLPAVAACSWDVVVVDEAHGMANDSDRREAVAALAGRAAYVILLTATPHNGDPVAYRSLCAIGDAGDRLTIFRRTREIIGSATSRRVHRLLLRPNAEERRMHALLAEFGRAVRAEHEDSDTWLGLAVLHKRAYSSAHALWRTIARRLAAIDGPPDEAEQLALPLDGRDESDAADEAPRWTPAIALRDRAVERRLLTALAAAARAAADAGETKLTALARLLRRLDEPAIVFTEYRDTLAHVAQRLERPATVLHGGLSRPERTAALQTFAEGGRALLLATDAAGEGLNLQRACRTVVNLELPWNPMRLEQRIGRVDRIGQRRTVHVFHLIAARTGEERLLASLHGRIARARADIGAANPLANATPSDIDVARSAVLGVGMTGDALHVWPDTNGLASYRAAALLEARRLEIERAFGNGSAPCGPGRPGKPDIDRPLVTFARNRHTRRHLGARILLVWEVCAEDGCGRRIASRIVAAAIPVARSVRVNLTRPSVEALIEAFVREAIAVPALSAAAFIDDARSAVAAFLAARLARERRIGIVPAIPAYQPGLFDRRAHHARAAARAAQQEAADAVARRAAMLERQAGLAVSAPELRLVLLP